MEIVFPSMVEGEIVDSMTVFRLSLMEIELLMIGENVNTINNRLVLIIRQMNHRLV